jgi:hypothetical protein
MVTVAATRAPSRTKMLRLTLDNRMVRCCSVCIVLCEALQRTQLITPVRSAAGVIDFITNPQRRTPVLALSAVRLHLWSTDRLSGLSVGRVSGWEQNSVIVESACKGIGWRWKGCG